MLNICRKATLWGAWPRYVFQLGVAFLDRFRTTGNRILELLPSFCKFSLEILKAIKRYACACAPDALIGGVSGWVRAARALLFLVVALEALQYLFGNDSNSFVIKSGVRTITLSTIDVTANDTEMQLCPQISPELGPIQAEKTEIDLFSIENKFPEVTPGGRYKPPNCTANHKVAIIIPYRDRQEHLAIFLNHMHPFLMKQQLEYGIFVIEQQDLNVFNRAKLFNVGFVESNRLRGGWQCFIFHDVDLLPLDERNLYTCPRQPRHMSASLDKFKFKLLYQELFGGVSAMTREQFMNVNGFSNKYWGWGGEDDDMVHRLGKMKYHIGRYKMSIARYTMLRHKMQYRNRKRYKLLSQTDKIFLDDGLSSLKYELMAVAKHRLFTLVSVNIDVDNGAVPGLCLRRNNLLLLLSFFISILNKLSVHFY